MTIIRFLVPGVLLAFANCTQQAALMPVNDTQEIRAVVLGDKLPADGCGAHLELRLNSPSSDSRTFMRLPTDATRPLMDKIIEAELAKQPAGTLWMGQKEVTITYRETGKTAALQCGWGTTQTLNSIDLLTIKER